MPHDSRVPLSPEERERNRLARAGKPRGYKEEKSDADDDVPAAFTDGDDGLIQNRYKAYLQKYGAPRDWNEALTAEKVRREIAVSVASGIDVEEKRGRLVDSKVVKDSVFAVRDLIYTALTNVPARVITAHPEVPANCRAALVASMQQHIDAACASAIKEAMKKHV